MAQRPPINAPELVLHLDNEFPIRAAHFAELLRVLAGDYKRLYGRELVIVGVPEGSLRARFREASQLAEEANHLLDFGKKIAGIFAMCSVGLAAMNMLGDDASGALKTAHTLAKISATSRSAIDFKYVGKGGEQVLLKATPEEAKFVQGETARLSKEQRHRDASSDRQAALGIPQPFLPETTQVERYSRSLKDQLRHLGDGGLASTNPEVRQLIVLLVLSLHESSPYRTSQLVAELEAEGNYTGAALIRQIISEGGGGTSTQALIGPH